MENNNLVDIKIYKLSTNIVDKKILLLLENKEDSNEKYQNDIHLNN